MVRLPCGRRYMGSNRRASRVSAGHGGGLPTRTPGPNAQPDKKTIFPLTTLSLSGHHIAYDTFGGAVVAQTHQGNTG